VTNGATFLSSSKRSDAFVTGYYGQTNVNLLQESQRFREGFASLVEQDLKEVIPRTRVPVWGMEVDEKQTAARVEHMDKSYYFRSESCKKELKSGQHKYIQK